MHTLIRRLATLFAALLSCLSVQTSAQQRPPAPQPAARETTEIARPALWKVADEDTTIWLFGTIHALPPGVQWFDGQVARAFDGSQELVTEIVESEPAQMQALVARHAMLPQGQALRTLLPEGERKAYEQALAGLGVPPQAFDPFEPWYAAVALATLPIARQGFASEHGVEGQLDDRAKARKLPHGALETAEFQLALFDSLPQDTQVRYLSDVVETLPTLAGDLAKMLDAWKRGDAERLAELMNEGEDDPALMKALLTDRNRNWAGWIAERMKRPGTVFVAVGAGHLAGPGSVQQQLAEKGVATTRVQ